MMVVVLQAIWQARSLVVWGERAGAAASGNGAARSPFAAPAELRAALGDCLADTLLAAAAEEREVTLRLPAVGDVPLASPEARAAGAQRPGGEESPRLRVFRVPGLAFSPAQAMDLLAGLPKPSPACGGQSLGYWVGLAQLISEALAQRQFYPDLEVLGDEQLRATWRVLIPSARELAWLERYTAAMPPACRAAVGEGSRTEYVPEAARLVESFLMNCADAVIRRDLSNDAFFQNVVQRAAQPQAGPRPATGIDLRWVAALLGDDPVVRTRGEERSRLIEQVRSWVSRLDIQRSLGATRLVFRLEEPEWPEEAPAPDETMERNEIAEVSEAAGAAPEPEEREFPQAQTTELPWRLMFALQPLDEDGPLIEAEELWARPGEPSRLLGRQLTDRRAQLLSHLTAAAQVVPLLERAVHAATPTHLELTTPEAHLFLRQWGPQLTERGYGVVLPSWVARRQVGLQLLVHPHEESATDSDFGDPSQPRGQGGARFGLDSLLDFDWQVAVGDLTLAPDEFRHLLELRSPLIRHRGQWLQLDVESAERALRFIDSKPHGSATLADAIRIAFFPQDAGLPILGLRGTGWLEHLLEQTPTAHLQHLTQPKGFQGELRPYQLRGLDWLAFLARLGIGGCLADDMGLGKTIQLIALLLHEREGLEEGSGFRVQGSGAEETNPSSLNPEPRTLNLSLNPTLLFAPTSVVSNWARELARFAPSLRVMVHHGPERAHGEAFARAAGGQDIVLTSYALAQRDVADFQGVGWERIALDEAQKIKNPNAASTLAIRSLVAPQRLALTGTPIENHLSELWSIMEILNPGLLGSAGEFRERFAVPIEKLRDAERSNHLRKMIQPFVLRRSKSDPQVAADLPEKLEAKVYCNLTPEQATWYERVTSEMLGQIDAASGIRRRGLILAALTRLKQICDHPELVASKFVADPRTPRPDPQSLDLEKRSGKCERLVEMLEEVIDEGDAALIFTQYREMGHLLEQLIARRLRAATLFLHGGVPAKQRDEMVQQFNAPQRPVKLFILSLRAGGLGLNLTAANHVFHFDRWWNPAIEAQATDRAHRIGQTRTVQVHKFVCVGTLEERIDRMLTEKLALAQQIVGSGDDWLTGLSTEQLREYLTLSKEAVGEY